MAVIIYMDAVDLRESENTKHNSRQTNSALTVSLSVQK